MLLPIIIPILWAVLDMVPPSGKTPGIGLPADDPAISPGPGLYQPKGPDLRILTLLDTSKPGGVTHRTGTADDHQKSGIRGIVYSRGGNHMPAPNRRVDSSAPGSPTIHGVRATVYVFGLASDSQVVHVDPTHYRAVLTPLISRVETDERGQFQVFLPPGTYSVFTKKGDLFYASRRDEKNHIAPVDVLPGKMTRVLCSVESDHKAVY